ncbi:MAG: transposase [Candidatus Heimdallarchaeaceae archaeon]
MGYKLDKSSHAVLSLHYHLIHVTKYRRPVLETEQIRERLKEIF